MKLHRKFKFALLGIATLCVAINSEALTLGRAKGAVFLGQALKLTVPVQVESGEGASAMCFEADVFYGDIRQDASRVRVGSEFSPQTQTVDVTVAAATVVDEPVVTVYVRVGCEGKTSRRYVLLAEPAPQAVPQPNRVRVPSATLPVAAAAPSGPVPQPEKVSSATERRPRKSKPAAVSPTAQPEQAVAATKPAPVAAPPHSRRSRLKLDPWDLTHEREPTLKLSSELALDGGEDLQKRTNAAALWRSLNTTPQDVRNADGHTRELEAGLKGLRDTTAKNTQILEELTQRLDKAESGRYANPVVYALLLVLLLLCGCSIGYARLRARRVGLDSGAWWRDGAAASDAADSLDHADRDEGTTEGGSRGDDDAAPLQTTARVVHPAEQAPRAERAASRVTEVDIDLDLDAAEGPQLQMVSSGSSGGRGSHAAPSRPVARAAKQADFAGSMSASLRSVNTKEMLDVRQQAEFFMTLGQHDEAIALLSERVATDGDADPLVYLDLLKILHTLGRKMDYDRHRNSFNTIFNGYVPIYADFNQPGSGLEAYPHVCKRIVALWPTEEVVAYIESCLVRADSGNSNPQQLFDLGALRDLLMLHGVAKRIATSSFDSGFMPFSTAKVPNADPSLPDATQPVSATQDFEADATVDFDISAPPGNLIDFDSSDLLPPPSSASPAKRRG